MKRVYLCAPPGPGPEAEWQAAKRYARYVLLCGAVPVAPQLYPHLLPNQDSGEASRSILWMCDEVWVFGKGQDKRADELLRLCRALNLPVRKVSEHEVTRMMMKHGKDDVQ